MVKIKNKILLATAMLLISTAALNAEVKPSVKTNFTTGLAHISDDNFWYTSSSSNLKADSINSQTVKAYFDASVSLFSLPETSYITAGFLGTLSLNKTYVKIRLPWINNSYMRISCGRMPLSWGYGLYYNAGDILFGSNPQSLYSSDGCTLNFTSSKLKSYNNTSALSLLTSSGTTSENSLTSFSSSTALSDVRTMTDWMSVLYLPFGSKTYTELVALPPIDTALNSNYGRFGGRIVFQPQAKFLESIEGGTLLQGNADNLRAYLALDGTIWADYNLCSSIKFDFTKDKYFDNDNWNISSSLFKSFTIQSDTFSHSLSERIEALYYPLAKNISLLNLITFTTTESTSINFLSLANFDYSNERIDSTLDYTVTCALLFSWTPVQALQLSVQGIMNCVDPKDLACVIFSAEYKY